MNCQKVKFTMSPWPLVPALHEQTEDALITIRSKITLHLQFFNEHFLRCFMPFSDYVVLHLDESKLVSSPALVPVSRSTPPHPLLCHSRDRFSISHRFTS